MVPGFCFESAASSSSEFTLSAELTTITWVLMKALVIGSKSFSGL